MTLTSKTDEINEIFEGFYCILPTGDKSERDYSQFQRLEIDNEIYYHSFCDDFGPMNLGMVHKFCSILDQVFNQNENRKYAIVLDSDRRKSTNMAFLIGTYMIMRLGANSDAVMERFASVRSHFLTYRDVSPGAQNFHLYLQDCWEGLYRAKKVGWIDFNESGFDADEYAHLDDPFNADMHEMVRGKFFAMRGPVNLPNGQLWSDRGKCTRDFSPKHFLDILEQLDVHAVVRLNAPEYSADDFIAGGVAVADLAFEDCSTPPPDVVAKFLTIAECIPGALAVHCKAGLGRTGTLIALYMMKHHGFTARQAIGWLRIVRPGSVMGVQQDYLCGMQHVMHVAGETARRLGPHHRFALRPNDNHENSPAGGQVAPAGAQIAPAAGGQSAPAGGVKAVADLIARVGADVDCRFKNILRRNRHAAAAAAAASTSSHACVTAAALGCARDVCGTETRSLRRSGSVGVFSGAAAAAAAATLTKPLGVGKSAAAVATPPAAGELAEHVTKASERRDERRQRAVLERLRAAGQDA